MSDSNEERSPGWKRSLIGKLIAAGIFVVIGTVAVAVSMRAFKNDESTDAVADAVVNAEPDQIAAQSAESTNLNSQPLLNEKPSGSFLPRTPNPGALDSSGATSANSDPSEFNAKRARPGSVPKLRKVDNSFDADNGFNPGQIDRFAAQRPSSEPPEGKSFAMTEVITSPSGSGSPQENSFNANAKQGFESGPVQLPSNQNLTAKSPTEPFQQLTNRANEGTNEFVNNALGNASSTTQEVGDKPKNALRNFGDRGEQNSENPVGRVENNSAAASTFSPAATGNDLPPIIPRASFDTSKELLPFNQQTSTPRPQLNPMQAPQSAASSDSSTGISGIGSLPTRDSTDNPANLENNRLNPPPANQNAASPTANQVASSNLLTQSTPGDRNLEGMQSPSVTIEKIAPSEIQVNQPADFQLVVRNTGRIIANNVRVSDQIPTGSELIQAVPQPSRGPGNQISWELDSLDPGQEKRIKIQLRPTQPGEMGSVAQVTFAAQASMRTRVTKPVLSLQHSAESRVLIGDPVMLDIDVKNEGDGPAIDVFIQEDLPEGLEFSEGFRELEYAIGTLGPGQSKNVRLELRAAKIGKYRNIMVAHADGGLQTQHAIDLEVVAPNLVATGEGPTRRFLGRPATHRFAIRNSGTATATNVELVSRLPSGLKYVEANNRGRYDENSHAVYWSLAELNSGLVANVEVTTVPIEAGNQDLNFEASADLGQSAKTACQLAVEHLVDVFFDIDDLVDPIEVGSDTAYQLRIVNQGTKTATNVQLAIEFPAGIQPTAVEGRITSEIRGQQIAFSPITSMNPGDEIEITIKAKGVTPGDHRVSVNLISDGREVDVSKQESTRVYSDR